MAAMRLEPTHRSEMVSQLLFGERAAVLKEDKRGWIHIRSLNDSYEGWCRAMQTRVVDRKLIRQVTKAYASGGDDRLYLNEGSMWLPAGAELTGLRKGKLEILGETGHFKGKKLLLKNLQLNEEIVRDWVKFFMNSPYFWGGRTTAGIDCSGLSQMVFKLSGIQLPRDASQQALLGVEVPFLQAARCGDLAFFENDDGPINHVGILLDATTIAHATETSGRVVVDKMDTGGIVSRVLRRRTHSLRFIKRYLSES